MSVAVISSDPTLQRSRDWCASITRQAARNFYYGLRLLPEPKRSAMFALYAYMRLVDDIADEEDGRSPEQRRGELEKWQEQTRAAIIGGSIAEADHPLWPAFVEMVRRHSVPAFIFDEVIEGQRQDLAGARIETWEDLRTYCYRVAGVIGLASLCIWGFTGGERAKELAIERGVAFQLTNILRDLREDASRGRIYLPAAELTQFGVSESEILGGSGGEKLERLLRFQVERAQSIYDRSTPLEDLVELDSRPTLRAMTEIYHALLSKIAADPQRILRERVSLSFISKLRIGWRAVRARS